MNTIREEYLQMKNELAIVRRHVILMEIYRHQLNREKNPARRKSIIKDIARCRSQIKQAVGV